MGIFGSDPYDADSRNGQGNGNMSGRVYGTIDGQEVTAAFGLPGTSREGETYLADGFQTDENFWQHAGHDHYGSGQGRHNNGTIGRDAYTGPSN